MVMMILARRETKRRIQWQSNFDDSRKIGCGTLHIPNPALPEPNPKLEIRSTKQIPNPNVGNSKRTSRGSFGHLDLVL